MFLPTFVLKNHVDFITQDLLGELVQLLPKVSWQISYFNTYISWYFCIALFGSLIQKLNWHKENKKRTNRIEHLSTEY